MIAGKGFSRSLELTAAELKQEQAREAALSAAASRDDVRVRVLMAATGCSEGAAVQALEVIDRHDAERTEASSVDAPSKRLPHVTFDHGFVLDHGEDVGTINRILTVTGYGRWKVTIGRTRRTARYCETEADARAEAVEMVAEAFYPAAVQS